MALTSTLKSRIVNVGWGQGKAEAGGWGEIRFPLLGNQVCSW